MNHLRLKPSPTIIVDVPSKYLKNHQGRSPRMVIDFLGESPWNHNDPTIVVGSPSTPAPACAPAPDRKPPPGERGEAMLSTATL